MGITHRNISIERTNVMKPTNDHTVEILVIWTLVVFVALTLALLVVAGS